MKNFTNIAGSDNFYQAPLELQKMLLVLVSNFSCTFFVTKIKICRRLFHNRYAEVNNALHLLMCLGLSLVSCFPMAMIIVFLLNLSPSIAGLWAVSLFVANFPCFANFF
jgi:hypothetical protein